MSFIAPIIVDTALGAIDRHIGEFKVLVHCNQGLSRSPSIALLYLLKHTDALGSQDPAVRTCSGHGGLCAAELGEVFAGWLAHFRSCSKDDLSGAGAASLLVTDSRGVSASGTEPKLR